MDALQTLTIRLGCHMQHDGGRSGVLFSFLGEGGGGPESPAQISYPCWQSVEEDERSFHEAFPIKYRRSEKMQSSVRK